MAFGHETHGPMETAKSSVKPSTYLQIVQLADSYRMTTTTAIINHDHQTSISTNIINPR